MGDLRVGDAVFDERGTVCAVTHAFPIVLDAETYRLRFDDGAEITACADHKWGTLSAAELAALTRRTPAWRAARRAARKSRVGGNKSQKFTATIRARNAVCPPPCKDSPSLTLRTTREIADTLLTKAGRRNHAIPVAGALDLPPVELPVDPYVLGVWLGDGTTKAGNVTSADAEILEAVAAAGYVSGCRQVRSGCQTVAFKKLRADLARVGVFGNKHIPVSYLRASRSQRLDLLCGLMDTDGHASPESGKCEFTTTAVALSEGVADLIHGLGWKVRIAVGRATLNGKDCGAKYRLTWTASEPVFRLQRKLRWQRMASRRTTRYRYVVSCERVVSVPMRCISVDSPSRLYLAGKDMVPTHNSDALIMEATRYVGNENYRALILRRTFPQLQEIIDRCWKQYPSIGGVYRSTEHRWYFPSGATITLGHMQHEDDKYSYQGKEYHFVGFDEVTQFTETQYLYMHSRLRSTDPSIPPRIRATTNPGGIGHSWAKARFVDVCPAKQTYVDPKTGQSRAFIPARVYDNPSIMENDPAYIARLESLPKIERKRLLDGDWTIFEGQFFPELSQRVHGCEPFDIPPEWERFAVLDWGYAKPFSVGWYAVDYDKTLWRYREWYGCKPGEPDVGLRLIASQVAEGILEREGGERVRLRYADPSIYNKLGGIVNRKRECIGGSVAEDMQAVGIHWLKADNDRVQGWQQVHKRLSLDEHVDTETGEVVQENPRLVIFNTCREFWRTVPNVVADTANPDDLDTDQEDHIADELRYACMARPVAPRKLVRLPATSFAATRTRLIRAKEYALRHGVSIQAAYQRTR